MSNRTATSQLNAQFAFEKLPMDMLKDLEHVLTLHHHTLEHHPTTTNHVDRRLERYMLAARRAVKSRQLGNS